MSQLYRITPLEKKSVEYFVDAFERMPDGTIRGFDVTEVYRWGQGFRELDDLPWKFEVDPTRNHGVHCDPQIGWGCELDDLCGVYVNFSEGYTDQEKESIEALLRGEQEDDEGRWGTAWIYDGDNGLEIEEDFVRILGPVKIDLIDEDLYNNPIEENIAPYDPDKQEP